MFSSIKQNAEILFSEARFISHIHNEDEYIKALSLMEELIEEYDRYSPLIDVLSRSIEEWEEEFEEIDEFEGQFYSGTADDVVMLADLVAQCDPAAPVSKDRED